MRFLPLLLALLFLCPSAKAQFRSQIQGEKAPRFPSKYVPVFAKRPEEMDKGPYLSIAVGPESQLVLFAKDSEWDLAWRASLQNWKAEPGSVDGKTEWMLKSEPVDWVFYADKLPEGVRPPGPLFTLNEDLLERLSTLALSAKLGFGRKDPSVVWVLDVGQDGHVTKAKSPSELGRDLLRSGLKPILMNLEFEPATQDGKPVACRVVLEHRLDVGESHRLKVDVKTDLVTPPPVLSEPYAAAQPLKVTATVFTFGDGGASAARLSGDVPQGPALDIFRALRQWQLPVTGPKFNVRASRTRYTVCYELVPGKSEVEQDCSVRGHIIQSPELVKSEFWSLGVDPYRQWAAFVTLRYTITKEGKVEDIKALACSTEGFRDAMVNALKGWRFKPLTVDGEPRGCTVEGPFTLNVGNVIY